MNNSQNTVQRDPEDTFDRVLRTELSWQAPPDLTKNLLQMARQEATTPAPVAVGGPKTWYTILVTILTVLAVSLSLMVAWQMYGEVGSALGLLDTWRQAQLLPLALLSWLYQELPPMRFLLPAFELVQQQLHWLLVAIVLWLALDGWTTRPNLPHQQHTTS